MKQENAEEHMADIINLDEVRKKRLENKEDNQLDSLYSQLDDLMKQLENNDPLEFSGPFPPTYDETNNFVLSPSVSALYNAYYTLIAEDREDLAELVADIIKMT